MSFNGGSTVLITIHAVTSVLLCVGGRQVTLPPPPPPPSSHQHCHTHTQRGHTHQQYHHVWQQVPHHVHCWHSMEPGGEGGRGGGGGREIKTLSSAKKDTMQKHMSQEEHNGANFNFAAPSSNLRAWKEMQSKSWTIVHIFQPKTDYSKKAVNFPTPHQNECNQPCEW